MSLLWLFLFGLFQLTVALPRMNNLFYKSTPKAEQQSPYNWTEEYFEYMPIDHFSFADHRTFGLRYFINLDHYTDGGPIFLYTGNEGNLETYTINSVIISMFEGRNVFFKFKTGLEGLKKLEICTLKFFLSISGVTFPKTP